MTSDSDDVGRVKFLFPGYGTRRTSEKKVVSLILVDVASGGLDMARIDVLDADGLPVFVPLSDREIQVRVLITFIAEARRIWGSCCE